MAALLQAADFTGLVEHDLTAPNLQLIIDAEDASIVELYGAHTGDVAESFSPGSHDEYLFLSRRASTITSITETYVATYGETTITLAASDYTFESSRRIRRKIGGQYPRSIWAPRIVVTFTPVDESAKRKLVLVELVKVALRYDAASMTMVGDTRVMHVDREVERAKILGRLSQPLSGFFA